MKTGVRERPIARKRATSHVKLKRAYDTAARSDGRRILVDRMWPRGVAREALQIVDWVKDAAPSAALRKWFGHEPARWPEFKRRYFQELDRHPEALMPLVEKSRAGMVDCTVELDADRAAEEPRVFTRIHMHFVVSGRGLDPRKVERAIALSVEKYCSAVAMLEKTAKITHDFELADAPAEPAGGA